MKFHLQKDAGINVIAHFGDDYFHINEQRFSSSVIVTPESVTPWQRSLTDLSADDFSALLEHRPETIILGTGTRIQFPEPALTRPLIEAQVGLETMTTDAACRTYNVLAGDRRKVTALLFLERDCA